MTETNKPGLRGEPGISRKTIAQGMPERSALPVVTMLVCFFSLAHKAAGAALHPAFPAPSCRLRDNDHAKLGHRVPRERGSSSAKNSSFRGDPSASNPESMAQPGHEERWIPGSLRAPRIDGNQLQSGSSNVFSHRSNISRNSLPTGNGLSPGFSVNVRAGA